MTKILCFCFTEIDLIPFFVTFISSLIIGIEMGFLIGIGVDIIKVLYFSARPNLLIENKKVSYNSNTGFITIALNYLVLIYLQINTILYKYVCLTSQNHHCSTLTNSKYTNPESSRDSRSLQNLI